MSELLKLAERCEAATGPDRELDALIKEAVGDAWDYGADWGPRGNCHPVAKSYSASLDAAMLLVPEGWAHGAGDGPSGAWAWVAPNDEETWVPPDQLRNAATPALALCAAALRSLAAQEPSS